MSGPIALAILAAVIIAGWKYRVQIRDFFRRPAGRGAQAPQQPAAAQAAAGNPPAVRPAGGDGWIFWTAALVAAALTVFYFWVYNDPSWSKGTSVADLHAWAWDRWVGILVLAGILWALVEFNAARLGGAAHVLRQMLLWGVLALFVGSLVLSWFAPGMPIDRTSQRAPAAALRLCPDVSAQEARTCLVTSDKWSNWIQFADGARDNGKQICFPFGVLFERKDDGATFWRFKAESGELVIKYKLFPASDKCSDVSM